MSRAAMSMFVTLLDRSIARIGESAADGRFFDREEVARIADVWDNNTFPLVGAAVSRPDWLRERRARAALGWMADLGAERRAWMIEQAAAAGHRLEPLLGPATPEVVYRRDFKGRVYANAVPLTTAGVAEDYDLAGAEVRTVRVERAGRKLSAFVALVAPRRYAFPADVGEAVLQLSFDDVRAVRFDSDDRAGAALATTAIGTEVRLGGAGRVDAASGTVSIDDPGWHLSRAGQAADANLPSRPTVRREPRKPLRLGVAWEAAWVLHQAMLSIRMVRHAMLVGQTPVREMCAALAGAGDRILVAAARPRSARDREFRRLTEEWIDGSPHLAHWVARMAPEDHWLRASRAGTPRPAPAGPPARAQLTLAAYTAAHTRYDRPKDANAVINLAVPEEDGGWGLQAMEFPQAGRLTLDDAAFAAPHAVVGADGGALTLSHGPLAIPPRAGAPG